MPATRTSRAKVPSSANKNKTLLIILEEQEHRALKHYAARKRRSMSDLIREKIQNMVNTPQGSTPGFIT